MFLVSFSLFIFSIEKTLFWIFIDSPIFISLSFLLFSCVLLFPKVIFEDIFILILSWLSSSVLSKFKFLKVGELFNESWLLLISSSFWSGILSILLSLKNVCLLLFSSSYFIGDLSIVSNLLSLEFFSSSSFFELSTSYSKFCPYIIFWGLVPSILSDNFLIFFSDFFGLFFSSKFFAFNPSSFSSSLISLLLLISSLFFSWSSFFSSTSLLFSGSSSLFFISSSTLVCSSLIFSFFSFSGAKLSLSFWISSFIILLFSGFGSFFSSFISLSSSFSSSFLVANISVFCWFSSGFDFSSLMIITNNKIFFKFYQNG